MIVNVEFFDENPIENVITSLNYKIDKTIFFGSKEIVEKQKKYIGDFLKKRCGVQAVEFYIVDDFDLTAIIDAIFEKTNEELKKGNRIYFDLTGGEKLLLVAFGILSRELNAPMHVYDVESNQIYEYGYEGVTSLSEDAKPAPIVLDLDGFISLYGGKIDYRMQKDYKSVWGPNEVNDIKNMWELSRKYSRKWLSYSALLRKFEPNNELKVEVDTQTFVKEIRKNRVIGSVDGVNRFLNECASLGFLKNVQCRKEIYRFTYASPNIKNYFWDGGSILEMYTFLQESRKQESNDCRVGVHIDWDGVIHNVSSEDVLNEIDIMSIRNNLPTFISCKIGNVDQTALYELETVANRFGGKYVKKVLAVAKEVTPALLLRAKEMKIEIRQMSRNIGG